MVPLLKMVEVWDIWDLVNQDSNLVGLEWLLVWDI
jgi:hypothetical protein